MNSTVEDLSTPPTGQFRSSPFYVAITSLPASIIFAVLGSWACYATLPPTAAESLSSQIQLACLGTGAVSSATGVIGMVQRGLNLTDAKKQLQLLQTKAELDKEADGDVKLARPAPITIPAKVASVGEMPFEWRDEPQGEQFP